MKLIPSHQQQPVLLRCFWAVIDYVINVACYLLWPMGLDDECPSEITADGSFPNIKVDETTTHIGLSDIGQAVLPSTELITQTD